MNNGLNSSREGGGSRREGEGGDRPGRTLVFVGFPN